MYNEKPAVWRQLVIIETSPRWRRKNEYDMPVLGTITEIVKQVQYPEAFIRNFNHCALVNVSMLWAGFTEEYPEIGKVVTILPYNVEMERDCAASDSFF